MIRFSDIPKELLDALDTDVRNDSSDIQNVQTVSEGSNPPYIQVIMKRKGDQDRERFSFRTTEELIVYLENRYRKHNHQDIDDSKFFPED